MLKRMVLTGTVLSLGACTSIPRDGGVSDVAAIVRQNTEAMYQLPGTGPESSLSADEVSSLLAQPISLETAERISVEANPAVRAKLAQVGIAEADYAQAGRLENPGLTYERFSEDDNSASLLFDIGGLILMPLKRRMESRRLEAARYTAATAVLAHVSETRTAWINAVAEKQQTALIERAVESLETSNNLTRQMSALGHSSAMEAAQSELVLGEMQSTLIRQRLAENAARETLIRQLGLWGDQVSTLQVPGQLPALPDEPMDIPAVEQESIRNRLDVQMAKFNLEVTAKNLNLTRLNPFLSSIEFGPVREQAEGETERGYEIELRLPIFDAGGIKTRKARIVFDQAQAQAEVTAVSAASAARQALVGYQSSWDIANHMGNNLFPLRQRISDEKLLQYNGMLISVFDLLNDLVSSTMMEANYVNAVREFWLAETGLQNALTGAGNSDLTFGGAAMMPDGGSAEDH